MVSPLPHRREGKDHHRMDHGSTESLNKARSRRVCQAQTPTSTPEWVDHPLKGQGFFEFRLILAGPGDITGQPFSPPIDPNGGFENLEHGRVDALPPSLAEPLQPPSDLIWYAADRQSLGHDSTIT